MLTVGAAYLILLFVREAFSGEKWTLMGSSTKEGSHRRELPHLLRGELPHLGACGCVLLLGSQRQYDRCSSSELGSDVPLGIHQHRHRSTPWPQTVSPRAGHPDPTPPRILALPLPGARQIGQLGQTSDEEHDAQQQPCKHEEQAHTRFSLL